FVEKLAIFVVLFAKFQVFRQGSRRGKLCSSLQVSLLVGRKRLPACELLNNYKVRTISAIVGAAHDAVLDKFAVFFAKLSARDVSLTKALNILINFVRLDLDPRDTPDVLGWGIGLPHLGSAFVVDRHSSLLRKRPRE